jgi:hypothetical protein
MKKSIDADIQNLNNIIRSISNIKRAFVQNEIESANILKYDELTQAACTQLITNIQESKKNLREKIYSKFLALNRIKLAPARNLASHNYDSLDFDIIYDL